jgi:hypothetical protein
VRLERKLEVGADLMAATVEVGQVDVAAERHVASGELRSVADAQVAVVVELVLRGNAGALGVLHGEAERHLVAVLGLHAQLLVGVDLVKNGDGGVVLERRLDNSVDAALLHANGDRVVGDGALANVVTGGETDVELVESHNGVKVDLGRGAQRRVEVDAHLIIAKGLLELARDNAAIWAERSRHRGLAEVLGEAGLAKLQVAVVVGVPRLLDCDSGAVKVALERSGHGRSAVVVRSLDGHVDAVGLGLHLELDVAKVEALAEEVGAGLAEVIKFWWSHGRGVCVYVFTSD